MKNLFIGIHLKSEIDTELLLQYLKIAEVAFDMTFDICVYTKAEELLHTYCPVFDILFLEVPLPNIDSAALLSHLRQCDSMTQLILISDSHDLYRLGYEYHARNFFTKPICYRNVYHELLKLFHEEDFCQRPHIWISSQHGDQKLYLYKLRYIETSNRQISLHYGNEILYINGTMCDFDERLCKEGFFRCNNSYLVNVDYIETIEKEFHRYCMKLVTGEILPLSRDKKKALEKVLGVI